MDRIIAIADPASLREFRLDMAQRMAGQVPRETKLPQEIRSSFPSEVSFPRPVHKPAWANSAQKQAAEELAAALKEAGASSLGETE